MNKIIIVHYEEDPNAISAFKKSVNDLWDQQTDYIRNAIISIIDGADDISAVTARLTQNQEDIGNSIAPYYGDIDAGELTALLKTLISTTINIIITVKSSTSTADLEAQWIAIANNIAALLDSIDPDNWPKDTVSAILTKYLSCILKEATSRASKDWVSDFAAYDIARDTIAELAAAESNGILDKFPEKFVMQYSSKTIKKKTAPK